MPHYTDYNREERNICAHLFRLLLDDQPNWGPLADFIDKIGLSFKDLPNPRVFCEVALLRDAYFARKPDTEDFMIQVCDEIAKIQGVTEYTRFNELDNQL